MEFMQNEIGTTGYTFQFVADKVSSANEYFKEKMNGSTLKSASCSRIGEGNGFLSNIYKVVFLFQDETKHSVALKVPSADVITIDDPSIPHNCESDFLNLIRNIDDLPIVQCFYAERKGHKRPGCILMEDLSDSCTGISVTGHISAEHCLEMAKALGKFQAAIATVDETLWKGVFKNDEFVRQIFESLYQKYLPKKGVAAGLRNELVEKCMRLTKTDFARFATKGIGRKYNVTTICHGDAHSNNILFYKHDDNSISNKIAAFIDWQTVFEGNPLSDLARFMVNCPNGNVRRAVEQKALDVYYQSLCDEYGKRGFEVPFSRHLCQKLYDYAFLSQVPSIMVRPMLYYDIGMKDDEERLKQAKRDVLLLRSNHVMEDAIPLIEKYGLDRTYKHF